MALTNNEIITRTIGNETCLVEETGLLNNLATIPASLIPTEQDNLFEDSLSTLAALLQEESVTEDLQAPNAVPAEITECDINDLKNFDTHCIIGNEANEVVELRNVVVARPPTPFSRIINLESEPTNSSIETDNSLNQTENESFPIQIENESSDSDSSSNTSTVSQEDLEFSMAKRSCKIVLTRCDNDIGKLKWEVRSNRSSLEEDESEVKSKIDIGDFVQVQSSLETGTGASEENGEFNSTAGTIEKISKEILTNSPKIKMVPTGNVCKRKRFDTKNYSEETKHIRIVPGGFECAICHKKFELRWNLVVHVRIHTNEKPFQCPDCGNKFRQFAHVQKHTRNVHRREVTRAEAEIALNSNFSTKKKFRTIRPSFNVNSSESITPSHSPQKKKETIPKPTLETRENNLTNYSLRNESKDEPKPGLMEEYIKNWNNEFQRKGYMRLIHPDTDSMIEVEEDLLMYFLQPFLNQDSDTSPLETSLKDEEKKELNLMEIHSKLKKVYGHDKSKDSITEQPGRRRGAQVQTAGHRKKKVILLQSNPTLEARMVMKAKKISEALPEPKRKTYSCSCKTCGVTYSCIAHLRKHMRTHANSTTLSCKCEDCGIQFENEAQLREHSKCAHNKILPEITSSKPESCNSGTNMPDHVETSIKVEREEKERSKTQSTQEEFENEYTEMKSCSESKPTLKRPKNEKHSPSDSETVNLLDSDHVSNKVNAVPPKIRSTNPLTRTKRTGMFKCTSCNKVFANVSNLQKHKIKSCPIRGVKTFKKSALVSSKPSPMELVENTNSPQEPIAKVVSIFGEVNGSQVVEESDNLQMNANAKDVTEGTFDCEICGKSFLQKRSMKIHMGKAHELSAQEKDAHSSVKPKVFECEICGKGFSRRDVLRNHIPVHSSERPFTCNVCNLGFKRQRSLNVHFQNVHTEMKKVCKCPICDATYSREDSLRKHVAKVHARQE